MKVTIKSEQDPGPRVQRRHTENGQRERGSAATRRGDTGVTTAGRATRLQRDRVFVPLARGERVFRDGEDLGSAHNSFILMSSVGTG